VSDRKKHNYVLILGLGASMLGASLAGFAQAPAPPKGYVLQWTDDFSGPALDTTKWSYRSDSKEQSAQRAQNIALDGKGHLDIYLRQEDIGDKHFTGGGVVSKPDFRYGYFEALVKTTNHVGWHTSFWMFAGDGRFVPPKFPAGTNASTEIDDLETESPTEIEMGVNEWQHGQFIVNNRCNRHYATAFDVSADYHLYGAEWTEQEITYYLDGKEICRQPYPPTQSPHDRLNIWLTSIAVGSGVKAGEQPSPASFGRVSYYVRDYYVHDTESGYAEFGPGWTDGELQGYSRLGTRSSCGKGASAVWTPTIMQAGRYEVSIYRSSNQHYDPAPRVDAHSHDGNASKTLNFKAGEDGWVSLGTFTLDTGSGNYVTLSGSGEGCLIADTVKFVRR